MFHARNPDEFRQRREYQALIQFFDHFGELWWGYFIRQEDVAEMWMVEVQPAYQLVQDVEEAECFLFQCFSGIGRWK